MQVKVEPDVFDEQMLQYGSIYGDVDNPAQPMDENFDGDGGFGDGGDD